MMDKIVFLLLLVFSIIGIIKVIGFKNVFKTLIIAILAVYVANFYQFNYLFAFFGLFSVKYVVIRIVNIISYRTFEPIM